VEALLKLERQASVTMSAGVIARLWYFVQAFTVEKLNPAMHAEASVSPLDPHHEEAVSSTASHRRSDTGFKDHVCQHEGAYPIKIEWRRHLSKYNGLACSLGRRRFSNIKEETKT
jgi:hypothetical protein